MSGLYRVEWLPGGREAPHEKCGYSTLRYIVTGGCSTVYYEVDPCFRGSCLSQFRTAGKFRGFVAIRESFHLLKIWGCGVLWQHQSFGGVASIGGTSEESVKVFSCASFLLHSSKLLDSIHYWERYVPYTGQSKCWTSNLS